MTTQLDLFNQALTDFLGARKITAVNEATEPARVLNDIWGRGAVNFCLSEGYWKFAIRTSQMVYDPNIAPLFGYQRAFAEPSDYLRSVKVCLDEYLTIPMTRYQHENGLFYSDVDYVYLSYISNDPAYGNDMTKWTESFKEFVAVYLAVKGAKRIVGDNKEIMVELLGPDLNGRRGRYRTVLNNALSKDALELPTKFLPQGAWVTARGGFGTSRRDGGSRFNLIG